MNKSWWPQPIAQRFLIHLHTYFIHIHIRVVVFCFKHQKVSQQPYLHLVIGNHDLKKFDLYERRFRIESIVMHPEFRRKGPYSNDISIIKIASNNDAGISFNSHVKPICLPKRNEIPKSGTWWEIFKILVQIKLMFSLIEALHLMIFAEIKIRIFYLFF